MHRMGPIGNCNVEDAMKCKACGAELAEGAVFCHACGAKVQGAATEGPVPAAGGDDSPAVGLRTGRRDDPETELWQGAYSGKAMLGSFVLAGIISIVCIAVGFLVPPPGPVVGFVAAAVVWAFVLAVLMYRRMNSFYRLTSQRFFHQSGILTRVTDRVEVIQMDDVTYTQGLFERLVGVGTIKITSSDPTHPELIIPGIADVQNVAEIIDQARRRELTRRGLRIESV